MKILLALTFVFGVLHLLTLTKAFDTTLETILFAIFPKSNKPTFFRGLCTILGMWFFYFSLVFQAWYWLFSGIILK
jgi:hypothetical protein